MIPTQAVTAEFLQIDDPRWPQALQGIPHDYFHLPGYLVASALHEGGTPMAFLLETGDGGMLVPLIKRPLAGFGEQYAAYYDVTSPYGYPGPLYWGKDWEARLPEMHALFENCLQKENVVSLFLRLNPFAGPAPELLAPLGTVRQHGPTVYMDLRDPAQTWSGINSANRTFIARMLKRGYTVKIDDWDAVDVIIQAYGETMTRLEASPYYFFPKAFFQALMDHTAPHLHLATCFTPRGELAGGVFFTETTGIIQYYLTGIFEEHMESSPGKLLINALRLWGIERGHHTLNLGGGLGAHQDGLFQFKVRLSKLTATFSTFRKVILPEVYDQLSAGHAPAGVDDEYFPRYRKAM